MNDIEQELLAPNLYRILLQRFGDVKICRPGEEAEIRIVPDLAHRGYREETLYSGEYYRVNCPFCADTRYRLLINHLYGTYSRQTQRQRFHLVKCLNETNCLANAEKRRALQERIFGHMNAREILRIRRARPQRKAATSALRQVAWPGSVVPLSQLPTSHPAIEWLGSKEHDIEQLEKMFNIKYCTSSDKYPLCAGRLIIPISFEEKLVGWQARKIDSESSGRRVVKYYTMPGFPKSRVLYNWDLARRTPYLVVTEGVRDVWRIGRSGVAALGSSLSSAQEHLIASWWSSHKGKGTLVFLWDGDLWQTKPASLNRLLEKWKKRIPRTLAVKLDSDKDPGDYLNSAVWNMIYGTMEKEGIEILEQGHDHANT